MIKRTTQWLVVGFLLVACREVRGEPDPMHEGERDAARGVDDAGALDASNADAARTPDLDASSDGRVVTPVDTGPVDAASDAAARDASRPPVDGSPQPSDDGAALGDGQTGPYKWYDSALPPPEGAWPVDPQVKSGSVDAGRDPGCVLSTLGNAQGVGASCWHDTRDQTCFPTRTCNESLTLSGLPVPAPYYCTRPCLQHSDCGDDATCCAVPGLAGKACIVDGCRHSCR